MLLLRHNLLFRIAAATLVCIAVGCSSRQLDVFPKLENEPVWPEAPENPRIRYVGQVSSSDDLRANRDFGQSLNEAIFGKKSPLRFLSPYAICSDGADRLFVADGSGHIVHVVDLKSRKWSTLVPGNKAKKFGQPVGLAYRTAGEGMLYVSDSADGCVYTFEGGHRFAGTIGREFLTRPCGIAFDPAKSRLLIADAATHEIIALTSEGKLERRIGQRGTRLGEFNFPTNVVVDSASRIYVSDSLNFRVQQLDSELRPLLSIGQKGDMPGYFSQPKGLAIDSNDHLYVVDAHFESVQVFDSSGQLLLTFGEEGRGPGEFWLPAGAYFEPSTSRLWIADSYNKRLQAFEYISDSALAAATAAQAGKKQ